ncbi:MAG: hypothetical protein WCG06_05115 [Candidatus Omnitrophota bacterium]
MDRMKLVYMTFILCLAGSVCQAGQIQGVVASIDPANRQVVIRQADDSTQTVTAAAKLIAQLKPGSVVKVVTKPGTDNVQSLELEIS